MGRYIFSQQAIHLALPPAPVRAVHHDVRAHAVAVHIDQVAPHALAAVLARLDEVRAVKGLVLVHGVPVGLGTAVQRALDGLVRANFGVAFEVHAAEDCPASLFQVGARHAAVAADEKMVL